MSAILNPMKAVLLNSGGTDTLAVAILLKQQGYELHSVHIQMGQRNAKSIKESAQKIADKYCASHTIIEIAGHDFYMANHMKKSEKWLAGMLFQQTIFWSIAANYALSKGIINVAGGARPGRVSSLFEVYMKEVLGCNQTSAVHPELMFPLWMMTQEQVEAIFMTDEIWKDTISCNWADPPCGECKKCAMRKKWEG